jgi:hypothetical protein
MQYEAVANEGYSYTQTGFDAGVSGDKRRRGLDVNIESLLPGQLAGYVVDPSGATVPGTQVRVTNTETGYSQTAVTDDNGRWLVSGLRTGTAKIDISHPGFKSLQQTVGYNSNDPQRYNFTLSAAAATETVTVMSSGAELRNNSRDIEHQLKKQAQQEQLAASVNVTNLQRKVSGVLPVRVDVPHAGNSYKFVRPLVLDEETKVTFTYKTK